MRAASSMAEPNVMTIHVRYLGVMNIENTNLTLQCPNNTTVSTICEQLQIDESESKISVLVNQHLADRQTILQHGDTLFILQPLGGG